VAPKRNGRIGRQPKSVREMKVPPGLRPAAGFEQVPIDGRYWGYSGHEWTYRLGQLGRVWPTSDICLGVGYNVGGPWG
jgi:hypothetical protein